MLAEIETNPAILVELECSWTDCLPNMFISETSDVPPVPIRRFVTGRPLSNLWRGVDEPRQPGLFYRVESKACYEISRICIVLGA